jgi:hypothetical protein
MTKYPHSDTSTANLLTLEREMMAAEYLLDSLMEHAHKTRCPAIGPKTARRLDTALRHVRNARDLLRKDLKQKQRTLITYHPTKRPKRSTAWTCDCETKPLRSTPQ